MNNKCRREKRVGVISAGARAREIDTSPVTRSRHFFVPGVDLKFSTRWTRRGRPGLRLFFHSQLRRGSITSVFLGASRVRARQTYNPLISRGAAEPGALFLDLTHYAPPDDRAKCTHRYYRMRKVHMSRDELIGAGFFV